MHTSRLTKTDQRYFAYGLICLVVALTLDALFNDTMLAWVRVIQTVFLAIGGGVLAVYTIRVSRKL